MPSSPLIAEQPSWLNNPRHCARQRIETLVYADLGPDNGGFPINVSENGMAFQGIRPLEKDLVVPIKFKLPGIDNSVNAMAQVVWLNDSGKGGGLRFIDLSDDCRRVINNWLFLKAQPASLAESPAVATTQIETKESKSTPAIPLAASHGESPARTQRNAVAASPSPSPAPVAAAEAAAPKVTSKSTTDVLKPALFGSADLPRTSGAPFFAVGETKKRAWIGPFAWGLLTSIALMAILGVIAWQFGGGLLLHMISSRSAQPVSESEPAPGPPLPLVQNSVIKPGNKQTVIASAPLIALPKAGTEPPLVEPAGPKLTAHAAPQAKAVTPLKINPPNTLLQRLAATPKAMAPRPVAPAQPADFAPPTFTIQTNPELAPQLSVTLPVAPVQPAGNAAQPSAKIDAPLLVTRRDPVYPPMAKMARISGSVELHFTVSAEGAVRDVTVVKGNHMLAVAAIEAVQAWRYRPARRDGVPVATEVTTSFVFRPN